MKSHVGPSVSLAAIIVRACEHCHGKREVGKPCGTCGNIRPAVVQDLGVIATHKKSRWERFRWNVWGYHVAQRRIRKVNKEQLKENLGECG